MADEAAADTGGQNTIVQRSAGGDGPLSAMEAARALVDARRKDAAKDRTEQTGEARTDATADESASQEADTAQETGPGETQADDQAQETEPPIDPPRSWTKEDKELWKGLPRETQERLAERERSRETDFLKRQNAAAEQSKGLTAKEQAAEQVRAQYENALPMLLQALQEQHAGSFADIKSIADVERMAAEDWPRYVQWDAHQKKVAAVQQEVRTINERTAQEKHTKLASYIKEQNALFADKAPEFSDPKVRAATTESAVTMLKELGFSDDELGKLWHGESEISLHDHRMQLLIRDGVKYREAQAAAKKAAAKPVPQVQRPGAARNINADADDRVKALDSRLTSTGSLKDAARLVAARRAARH